MSDLVGNPEDRFSCDATRVHMVLYNINMTVNGLSNGLSKVL